jgi:diaminopimelate decarboxylase
MTLFEVLPSPRRGLTRHLDRTIWPLSADVDERGQLCIGGVAATQIAAQFGTPSYVVDEEDFRSRIRCYRATLPDAELIYAGKALLSVDVASWAVAEGAGVDVCSGGELAIALAGAVPPERIILHGSATTPGEMHDAVTAGVGRIVIDSPSQIALLAGWADGQRVLVRVIPDVHPGASGTGVIEQKFGFALAGGQARAAVKRVLDQPRLQPVGLHCQLGSQLTDAVLYGVAIRQMIAAMAEIRDRHQIVLTELSLGGGHAIPYLSGDPELDLRAFGAVIDAALESACAEHSYPRPKIVIEPGRAIAARAGITLYRVITVKRQPGGRTFVAVDGDMIDNPRPALPATKYTVALADRHRLAGTAPVTVVGRHCEVDNEIARDVELPADIRPGDLLAVACTGAYHHSMGSGRNLVGRPPLIGVGGGRFRELVCRETIDDLLARDRGWVGHESWVGSHAV